MRIKRWQWIVLQLVLMAPFIYSNITIIDMSRSEPTGGYYDESGKYIECEAVSPPSKYVKTPQCATYGSMETNKPGYALAWFSAVSFGYLLWLTSRPGRGLKISRSD